MSISAGESVPSCQHCSYSLPAPAAICTLDLCFAAFLSTFAIINTIIIIIIIIIYMFIIIFFFFTIITISTNHRWRRN